MNLGTVLGAKLLYRRLKPSGYATENFYFLIFLFLISIHTSDNPKTILGTSKICVWLSEAGHTQL